MTTPSRVPIPAQRPVGSRFRLHRAGIRNVWQYDEQEFTFGAGRLLLRGKNGAGKSKALEMLLPYLLDGDARALDATGTGRTTLTWLMLDGFEQTNRLGYLWVEFHRTSAEDGSDHYLTLGAAVRASKSTNKATPFFFVTPLRVGEDLHLVEEAGRPLSVERLKEAVGPENVTERAVEHRARVAHELFHLTDATHYRNLTQLLHRLRRPTIGDRIESGGLVSLLNETLPGLDEEIVEKVSRNLHDLDAVRDELGRLEQTDTALRTFLTSYRGYLHGVLRKTAANVSRELDELSRRRRESGDAAKKTAQLKEQEATAKHQLRALEEELQAARTELEALHASDGYRGLQELAERRGTVTALRTAAASAYTALSRAHGTEKVAADRLGDGVERFGGRLTELATEHRELLSEAERAGVSPSYLGEAVAVPRTDVAAPWETVLESPGGEQETVRHRQTHAVDTERAESALREWERQLTDTGSLVKQRTRMVREVERLGEWARAARADVERLDAERERVEEEAEQAAERLEASRAAVVTESAGYAGQVESWVRRVTSTVGSDTPALHEARAVVAREVSDTAPFPERVLPAEVDAQVEEAAHAALDTYGDALAAGRDEFALHVSQLAEECDRLAREKQEWQQRTDPEPPPASHHVAERSPGTGAPLYRLVDFADSLTPDEQAGLEAALESSGLLDAWVTADGTALDPATRDTLLDAETPAPDAPAPKGPTLASVLRPTAHPEGGVSVARVERVLSAVALTSATAAAGPSAVSQDGGWRLGAVHGRHVKEGAEYVGAAVRAETRRRKLAELEDRLDEMEQRRVAARAQLDEVDERRRALSAAWREFPRAQRLSQAWAAVESAEQRSSDLVDKVNTASRAAADARGRAVTARQEAEATASAHDLPTDGEALAQVRTALNGLDSGLVRLCRALRGTAEGLPEHRAELRGYQRSCADRKAADQEYVARFEELRPARQALRTLEETVGAAEEEILTREERAKRRVSEATGARPEAEDRLSGLHDQMVRAEEDEKRGAEKLDHQRTAVVDTGRELRNAVAHPEVLRGAELPADSFRSHLPEEPGADPRAHIRALRQLAAAVSDSLDQPDGDVSDTALLNRHTELRDQLAGGFDAHVEERVGIKTCQLVDDHGPHDVALVGERIAAQAAEARGRLTDREREVFQRFLTGELGDHLSAQVIAAANLVATLNETLKTVRTSHGLGVELQWRLDDDVDADVRTAVELLRGVSGIRTREESEQLREVLQRRIEDARRADPSAGYAAHLRTALDYRAWFRFHTYVVDDAAPGRKRQLNNRTGLSQGEQRVLSYLVLFAAASAHFTTLSEAAPHAPRIILLDDAFAKVDEPTHGQLGRILVTLDLDFVLTSERLMGNWPEVPALDIYECLRDPHVRGVATLHYTWNGRQRRLVSV